VTASAPMNWRVR